MSDNPRPVPGQNPGVFSALPGHRAVGLEGPDAARFAQAQFMSDVTSLAQGRWQWSGWLTPKGRVIALFALLKRADDDLTVILPDADPESFAGSLRRFVFRARTTIRVRDDLHVAGRFEVPDESRGNIAAGDVESGIELDLGGDGGPRTLRIGTNAASVDADVAMRWNASDLAHGLPRLGPSQVEQWTPQQLSLERLQAFSVKKGCYPGQEIVARTHFLGQAKRGLVLLEADAPLVVGSDVRQNEQPLGTVVSSADRLALAVLPLERMAAVSVDGMSVREKPLLGGLAR